MSPVSETSVPQLKKQPVTVWSTLQPQVSGQRSLLPVVSALPQLSWQKCQSCHRRKLQVKYIWRKKIFSSYNIISGRRVSFWNRSLTGFQFTVQFWRIWWANTRTIRFSPVLSRSSWIKVENKYFSDNLQNLYLIICIISIIVNHEMCSKLFILSLLHIFLNYFLLLLNQLLVKLVSFYETKIHTNIVTIISFWITERNWSKNYYPSFSTSGIKIQKIVRSRKV